MRRRASRRPSPPALTLPEPRRLSPGAAICLAAGLFLLAAAGPARAQEVSMDPHICLPLAREFTVAMAIGSGQRELVGLEVEVGFDPAKVQLLGIDPGTWVTGSGLDYFFYDHTAPGASTIHLTMAFLGASCDGTGQLAVCRFKALAEGMCPLEFLTLDVRDAANVDLGFSHSTGDYIFIEPAVGVDDVTWGGVKRLYGPGRD